MAAARTRLDAAFSHFDEQAVALTGRQIFSRSDW